MIGQSPICFFFGFGLSDGSGQEISTGVPDASSDRRSQSREARHPMATYMLTPQPESDHITREVSRVGIRGVRQDADDVSVGRFGRLGLCQLRRLRERMG